MRCRLSGPAPAWARQGPAGTARGRCQCSQAVTLPQVIQQPPKPGTLIRPPQVTLTQTPMVALRQPHNRIVLTTPQQIQLNPLQPGEAPRRGPASGLLPAPGHSERGHCSHLSV